MVSSCAVYGCLSSSRHDKTKSFYHFPKDELRCRQWVQAANRPELMDKDVETLNKNYRICGLHFNPTDRLVKRLKTNAVPTLMLPNFNTPYPDKTTQTEKFLFTRDTATQAYRFVPTASCATQTDKVPVSLPRKRKRKSKCKCECKKRKSLEDSQASPLTPQEQSDSSPEC